MQQYFIDEEVKINSPIILRDDILYHLKKVLRCTNEIFRICDINHHIFECKLEGNYATVVKSLDEDNELDVSVTAIIALIKSDKFELILQKLTELGVDRIVPYNAVRSVVKENKPDKKIERYRKILMEASEQSHRNKIPQITNAININDIKDYMSDINLIPYEKEDSNKVSFSSGKSITFIIGPEGGFDKKEYEKICDMGFNSISLGKRILRAETAAIYLTSLIVGNIQ